MSAATPPHRTAKVTGRARPSAPAIFRRTAGLRPALAAFAVVALMSGASTAATVDMPSPSPVTTADGVLRVQSTHVFDETVARLQSAVAGKGVKFFDAIDQGGLGADAGLPIGLSTLVLFGNPPLGVQFLQSNPYSGLDWPVHDLHSHRRAADRPSLTPTSWCTNDEVRPR
jgi:hypothetical protein